MKNNPNSKFFINWASGTGGDFLIGILHLLYPFPHTSKIEVNERNMWRHENQAEDRLRMFECDDINLIQQSLNDKIIYDDAKILLNQINNLNFKQACVSASPQGLLIKKLKEVGIENLFEYIIGGDNVKRNKPSPDIYNKAIENLQTTKNIIIEDSPTGIQAGKDSNSFVLAVNRGIFTNSQLSEADLIVDELSLEIINKILKTL